MTGISMLDLSLLRFTLGRVNNRSMEGNLPATKQLHFGHSNRAGRMMLGHAVLPGAASIPSVLRPPAPGQCNAHQNARGPSQVD
jgi:hypothetical protein